MRYHNDVAPFANKIHQRATNNQSYPTVSYSNQSSSGFINEVDSKFISEIERVHIFLSLPLQLLISTKC